MLRQLSKRIIGFMAAAVMAVSNTVPFFPISAFSTEYETSESELAHRSFELFPDDEESGKVITLEGLMPENASAEAVDVSEEHGGIAAYDITITDGGEEFQPYEDCPIKVEITDPAISEDGSIELWHIRDDGVREQVTNFTVSGTTVSFLATGFSVYEIVVEEDVKPLDGVGWQKINDVANLANYGEGSDGLYIGHTGGFFFMDEIDDSESRKGIKKTKIGANKGTDIDTAISLGAVKYYFEQPNANNKKQYYVYWLDSDGTKHYIINNPANSLDFTTSDSNKTLFEFSTDTYNDVTGIKVQSRRNTTKYWNMQKDENGTRFCAYDFNQGGTFDFWYYVPMTKDPYKLNGVTHSLINSQGGTYAYGLVANSKGTNKLEAKQAETKINPLSHNGVNFVINNADLSEWTFTSVSGDKYYVSSKVNGTTYYLKINSDGNLELSDSSDQAEFKVIPGTGSNEGEFSLYSNGKYVKLDGTNFIAAGYNSSTPGAFLFDFAEKNNLTPDDFIVYSANKVGVSEKIASGEYLVKNDSRIIIYTRIWDEEHKKYDFYAIDHDGSLVNCYERGDDIMWVGSKINTLLWDFTEYYYEGTTTSNNYYEFYNRYSGKYLAPQAPDSADVPGQILSDNTIGVNLEGRRDNQYYTKIMAWDDPHYAFAAIKADLTQNKIISCNRNEATGENTDFYFAIMNPPSENYLTTVETIDNNEYGIKMKMIDFANRDQESDFLGSNSGGLNTPPKQGLLTTDLGSDGYPKTALETSEYHDKYVKGKSLKDLFNGATEVNHLFIGSTYEATGYFEFDSCQNTATLIQADGQRGTNFRVFKELATDNKAGETHKHGQFFPYNTILPGVYSTSNPYNLYNALAQELDPSDPRKGERLHLLQYDGEQPNCYNGMELEASFVQTSDGKDAWDHDIIFEFTGDDDFWLYVDGELVIDLGGIHSALAGMVNFHTGEVKVNGTPTTLYELFRSNYLGRGHSAAETETYLDGIFTTKTIDNKECHVFKDYSSHTMRIFYMERGAGASNLHMRFNLSYVTPGSVTMSKSVTDQNNNSISDIDYSMIKYPYQIYYLEKGKNKYEPLTKAVANDKKYGVYYLNPKREADYYARYKPAKGDRIYENVFFLYPGKDVSIVFPDETISYYIQECAVDMDVYTSPQCNNTPLNVDSESHEFVTTIEDVKERPTIAMQNRVDTTKLKTLTVTKELYNTDGTTRIDDDGSTFSFRLYLTDESGTVSDDAGGVIQSEELKYAYMHSYYVVSPNDKLCRWDAASGKFTETEYPYADLSNLTSSVKNSVTFETSINGTISKIPAGYQVKIPNLMKGSLFRIEERDWENPLGYKLMGYECKLVTRAGEDESTGPKDPSYDVHGTANEGRVLSLYDPQMVIKNRRGFGLEANKVWSDKDYTTSHGNAYVAVYKKNGENETLVDGTVRAITPERTNVRYFFETLEENKSLSDYVIREVKLTGTPTADADGNVTGYTDISQVDNKGIEINAIPKVGEEQNYQYIPDYKQSELSGPQRNSRTDTVTNIRQGGVAIRLFKWGTDVPLKNGEFTLTKDGKNVGNDFYYSDKDGLVTVLFDSGTYILTETASPRGYVGMPQAITFTKTDTGVTSANLTDPNESGWVRLDNPDPEEKYQSIINIFNIPYTLKVLKVNSRKEPLPDAHFEIYKSAKDFNGTDIKDYFPISWDGSSDLVTGADGVVPHIDNKLKPMTYFLTETKAPAKYDKLEEDVVFTIDDLGRIAADTKYLTETENYIEDNQVRHITYTISVPNTSATHDYYFDIEKVIFVDKNIHDDDKEQKFIFKVERFAEGADLSNAEALESFYVTLNCEDEYDAENYHYSLYKDGYTGHSFDPVNKKVTITDDRGENYVFPAAVWTGRRTICAKKAGIYRITEETGWSAADYDFWQGSNVYKGNGDTEKEALGIIDGTAAGRSVVFSVTAVDAASFATESHTSGDKTLYRPTASFTNCESEYAYLSSQAYAENRIKLE